MLSNLSCEVLLMGAKPDRLPSRNREATRDEERLTEDEMARRKLGPHGVPSAPDTATMTQQSAKNLPKRGAFDGHSE
jgi:hypothetical protein